MYSNTIGEPFKKSLRAMSGLGHQYEEIWSRSMWQDGSHCSTGLLESSRLDPTPLTGRILNWLDQKNVLKE